MLGLHSADDSSDDGESGEPELLLLVRGYSADKRFGSRPVTDACAGADSGPCSGTGIKSDELPLDF